VDNEDGDIAVDDFGKSSDAAPSVIQRYSHHHHIIIIYLNQLGQRSTRSLQCFDTVGWTTRRTSGL